jgi:ankyrin repeat protein
MLFGKYSNKKIEMVSYISAPFTLFNSPTIFNLPNFELDKYKKNDMYNINEIHYIIEGIKYNKIDAIKILDLIDPTIKVSSTGWTFAFYAVAFNNLIMLEYLLDYLKFNINVVDNYGNSLLLVAIIYENFDIANYLINCNINLNIYNSEGHTAYTYALMKNYHGLMYMIRRKEESKMHLRPPPGLESHPHNFR